MTKDFCESRSQPFALLKRLLCLVFGHRYVVAQEFNSYSRRVVCPACRGDWAMNDDCRAFVPWGEEFAEL